MAVRQALGLHHGQAAHADSGKHLAHRNKPRAVEGGIDQVQLRSGLGFHPAGEGFLDEVLEHGLGNGFQQAALAGLRLGQPAQRLVGHPVDVAGDLRGHVVGDLAAVRAVDLIAVVLAGVMAGGDDHARVAAQGAHRKGKHGCGHQGAVDQGAQALFGQHAGGDVGKVPGAEPGVVGDGHGTPARLQQVVRQALAGPGHGVLVHAVGAHAQGAAQAARAEGQLLGEAAQGFLLVLRNQKGGCPRPFVKDGAVAPQP